VTDEQQAWQDNARVSEIGKLLSAVVDTCLSSGKYEPKDITRALVETTISTTVATFLAIDATKDYERAIDTANDYMRAMTDAVIESLRDAEKGPIPQ
jgi:hypothetical protein